jgi:hypothetical protein
MLAGADQGVELIAFLRAQPHHVLLDGDLFPDHESSPSLACSDRDSETHVIFNDGGHYLTELIDNAVRSELGRYKTSAGYRRFRHQDRYLANSSFTLGMVASIADKLTTMKAERDAVNNTTGRDLVVLKAAVVDAEFEKLDLNLRSVRRQSRMVSTSAYEAGNAAGASLAINPGIGEPPITRTVRKNS